MLATVHRTETHGPAPFRWTREEYLRLGETGIFRGRRVQLLYGEIIEMAPMGDPHQAGIAFGLYALQQAFGSAFVVRCQLPLRLEPDSDPEPDLAVVAGPLRTQATAPSTALLVVEVADTSLQFDRTIKARLYAANGIEEYWIVDLIARALEVHRRPGTQGYADVTIHHPPATIAPLAAPAGAVVAVADLLP